MSTEYTKAQEAELATEAADTGESVESLKENIEGFAQVVGATPGELLDSAAAKRADGSADPVAETMAEYQGADPFSFLFGLDGLDDED